jgi:Ricin-type beta-trefoil lectin domain/Putative Ig domain
LKRVLVVLGAVLTVLAGSIQAVALAAPPPSGHGVAAGHPPLPKGVVFPHHAAWSFGAPAIYLPRGHMPGTPAAGGNLLYNGGPIQPDPRIHVLFWGSWWASGCQASQGNGVRDENYLYGYYHGMGSSSDNVSPVASQYGDSGNNFPTFPTQAGHLFIDWAADCSDPPASATQAQLAAEASSYADSLAAGGQAIGINDQIVVVSPSGTNPGGGFGTQYCAWHSWARRANSSQVSFTNLPFIPDQGRNCFANTVQNDLDGWSKAAGHEYMESVTDPLLNAWTDSANNEIGDKCNQTGLFAETFPAGTFAQQPEWDNSSGTCQPTDSVEITVLPDQATNLHAAVSVQVMANSLENNPLTYSASGLPNGLTINSSTGLISGRARWPGNFFPQITAADLTTSISIGLQWRVYLPHGPLRLRLTSRCATGRSLTNGTKILIRPCNGGLAQTFAAFPNHTLRRYGGRGLIDTNICVNIKAGSTRNGALINLNRCNGHWSQVWKYNSAAHQWRNPRSRKCLRASKLTSGTQIELWTCRSQIRGERWTNV